MRTPQTRRRSGAKGLELARTPSGRGFRRLFGLARLGAHSLARRCRPDHGRPAGRPGRSLDRFRIWPELRTARRRELGFFGDHAGRHAADIGNLGAAQPERITGAGLLLFGGIGLSSGGRDRNQECRGQQPSKPKAPCSKNRHPSPQPKVWPNCGCTDQDSQAGVDNTPQHKCRGSLDGNSDSSGNSAE